MYIYIYIYTYKAISCTIVVVSGTLTTNGIHAPALGPRQHGARRAEPHGDQQRGEEACNGTLLWYVYVMCGYVLLVSLLSTLLLRLLLRLLLTIMILIIITVIV